MKGSFYFTRCETLVDLTMTIRILYFSLFTSKYVVVFTETFFVMSIGEWWVPTYFFFLKLRFIYFILYK